MKILTKISFLTFAVLFFVGCRGADSKKRTLTEGITISQLAAENAPSLEEISGFQADIVLVAFDVPSNGFELLKEARANLNQTFMDSERFEILKINGFYAGLGDASKWANVAEKLREANTKQGRKVNLLVLDDKGENIQTGELKKAEEIFYYNNDKVLTGKSVGPGYVSWQVQFQNIPTIRGFVQSSIKPVVFSRSSSFLERLQRKQGSSASEQFDFDFADVVVQMSPGDFVLLSPQDYPFEQFSPAELVFNSDREGNYFSIYCLVCVSVED